MDPNGNTFRSDCQTKYPISNGVFALPSTHSLCLVTAYRLQSLPCQTLWQGTRGSSSLSLSLQPHFLPLCLPTTSEMLAGPLTLCFCPASGPDTGCPLAHNPPPGFSSDLRAPSLSGPLQALHFPLVPSYRV